MRSSQLFLLTFVFFVQFITSAKLPLRRHPSRKDKCFTTVRPIPESSNAGDDDDDFPDNEVANESTIYPPNYLRDYFLDDETGDVVVPKRPKQVNFIGIKHRFSNETNMAFPSYGHISRIRKARIGTREDKKRPNQ